MATNLGWWGEQFRQTLCLLCGNGEKMGNGVSKWNEEKSMKEKKEKKKKKSTSREEKSGEEKQGAERLQRHGTDRSQLGLALGLVG